MTEANKIILEDAAKHRRSWPSPPSSRPAALN